MAESGFSLDKVEKFKSLYDSGDFNSFKELQAALGMNDSAHLRALRRKAEKVYCRNFPAFHPKFSTREVSTLPYGCIDINFDKPVNLVTFSDCHFWPTSTVPTSDSFKLLLQMIAELAKDHSKPLVIVLNGDGFDGASISRHPSIRWEHKPSVEEEINACKFYLDQVVAITGKHPDCHLYWTWGNHDERFDSRLANVAPQFVGVSHTSLVDHFPAWKFTQSLMVNNSAYFVHDIAKGKNAAYSNAQVMGPFVHVFTGHTHRLTTRAINFFKGKAKATETGTIATRNGPQFGYVRGNPVDWQEGFVVVQIDGENVYEEIIEVEDAKTMWRGQLWQSEK